MGRRMRRAVACALAGACMSIAAAAPSAQAYTFVYTDLSPFNLDGTWTSYGGGTQFHISSTGDGTASYRWLDVTTHNNYVSGNSCSDVSQYGQHLYLAGVTDYRLLFTGSSGLCFLVRGKTADGSQMYGASGRLQR